MSARLSLGALGVLTGLYGAWLLLSRQDTAGNVAAAVWLGAGVVLHDAVLVPVVLLVVGLGARLVPTAWRAPVAAGVVVLGSLTLMAVPVLGRFGARDDNATLLDRSYGAGWLAVAALVLTAVVVAGVRRSRAARPAPVAAGAAGADPVTDPPGEA